MFFTPQCYNTQSALIHSMPSVRLNKFFSSVFSQAEVTKSHLPLKRNLLNMPTITFDEDDILDRLSKLNITKSPGVDTLHPRVLQEARYEIVHALSIIFNKTFDSKQLPPDWKSAKICYL